MGICADQWPNAVAVADADWAKDDQAALLAGWSHAYDRIGNKKYQEDLQSATQSELYAYDKVYRVTSFKRGQLNGNKDDIASPSRTQTWSLDPLGNWDNTVVDGTTETRTHNTVNELTARTIGEDAPISLTYDAAGNVTQDGDSNGDHKYTWDYRNRLIEVEEKQSGNWNTVGEYKYDAQSRRVLKVVTNKGGLNGTTRFLWGGDADWQCLEERDSSGDLVARFTYSPGYIDAVAVQERDLNSDDDFSDANEVVYYHSNTLFTVYGLSDSGGSVIERYRYDAYGGATVLDTDGSADADGISDVENPYLFTGRRLDLESTLMQYRNRCYAPTLGRFVSRDPVGYRGGFGLYAYATARPTSRGDAMGLDANPLVGSVHDWLGRYESDPGIELMEFGMHTVETEHDTILVTWKAWRDVDEDSGWGASWGFTAPCAQGGGGTGGGCLGEHCVPSPVLPDPSPVFLAAASSGLLAAGKKPHWSAVLTCCLCWKVEYDSYDECVATISHFCDKARDIEQNHDFKWVRTAVACGVFWTAVHVGVPSRYDKYKHCLVGCRTAKDSSCGPEMAEYLAWQNECMDASDCTKSYSDQGDVDATLDGKQAGEDGKDCRDYCGSNYPHP